MKTECRIGDEDKPQPAKKPEKETTLERFNKIVDRKKLAMMKGMGLVC
jgi:hypothetical protein